MLKEAGANPDDIQLYDPKTNVALGTTYLKNLMRLFRGKESTPLRHTMAANKLYRVGLLSFRAMTTNG